MQLNAGDYDAREFVDGASVNLMGCGVNFFDVRVHVRSDWHLGFGSHIENLTIIPHNGSVILDNAAWSAFEFVNFDPLLTPEDTTHVRDWRTVKTQGTAVRTTQSARDANAWGVRFDRYRFAKLDAGILVPPSVDARVNGWILRDCVFEDVRDPLQWMGNHWRVYGGMAQVAHAVFVVNGNFNRIESVHVERCERDVWIAGGSGNFVQTDSKAERILDEGTNTKIELTARRN